MLKKPWLNKKKTMKTKKKAWQMIGMAKESMTKSLKTI